MFGAQLAFLVLLGQVAAPNPNLLVARLGSGRYAERQAAANALERIGRNALPALRSARDSRDPEVRTRVAALISRIEGTLLTQPTMVTLDFQDRPLAEVVQEFGARCGIKMVLAPEPLPAVSQRRVTLAASQPLSFWKALDRLCESAQLQYNFGGMQAGPASREPVFPLYPGGSRPAGPVSDSGPFRVNLVGLHYQRDLSFLPVTAPVFPQRAVPPRVPAGANLRPAFTVNDQFYAQLQVAAEPRLSLSLNGPLKILEAVDDQGQSLLTPAGQSTTQHFSGYFGLTAGSTLHLQAPLKRPDRPGQLLKKLRGVLPVLVASRKPDPLVIPLSGATGKEFHNADVTLGVQDIRLHPTTRQLSIDLLVRPSQTQEVGSSPENMPVLMHRPDTNQQQIEVLDSKGRPIPWYHSNDGEGARMTLTLTPHDQGAPAEIRYYAMSRAATEVSFEFLDVPLR